MVKKLFSLDMGSFSSSKMQYFHKGAGTPRITNSDKVAWKHQNVRENFFLFKTAISREPSDSSGSQIKDFCENFNVSLF